MLKGLFETLVLFFFVTYDCCYMCLGNFAAHRKIEVKGGQALVCMPLSDANSMTDVHTQVHQGRLSFNLQGGRDCPSLLMVLVLPSA